MQKQRQARLTKMISYADGTRCLRASLLRYFGETPKERCGACSVCCGEIRVEDITVPCQKILSCVARMKAAAKEEALLCVLRGERTPFVLENGFESLSTFGILSSTPPETVRDWLRTLLAQGFLTKDDSGTLRLCAEARAVLFAGQRVRRRAQTAPKTKRGRTVPLPDPVLLQRLEALCRLCAKRSGVPPFAVFTLRTLSVMAAIQPETVQEFSEIPGVSSAKIERYGAAFLREIKRYKALEAENL